MASIRHADRRQAHKLKNKLTTAFRLVDGIQKKFCLMLTATPVQNDLRSCNLITLLKPGQLGATDPLGRSS